MCLSAYVRAHQYSAAWKTRGVHMRTRTYVFGPVENARGPHAYVRVRTHYDGSSLVLKHYARSDHNYMT